MIDVFEICEKRKARPLAVVSPDDFLSSKVGEIDPAVVITDPTVSLYCLDHAARRAWFVQVPEEVDITAAAFMAGEYYAARGYAVLTVNLRGLGESEGSFDGPIPGAPSRDGDDTIEAPPLLSALLVRQASGFDAFRTLFGGGPIALAGVQYVAASWTRHCLEAMNSSLRLLAERRVQEDKAAVAAAGQRWAEHPTEPGWRIAIVAPTSLNEPLSLAPNPFFAEVADFYNEVCKDPT